MCPSTATAAPPEALRRLDHAPRPLARFLARRERAVDDRAPGVDGCRACRRSHVRRARSLSVSINAASSIDVRDAVDRRQATGEARREHELRRKCSSCVAFVVDRDVEREVDRAESEPLHARSGGKLARPVEADSGLHQRQQAFARGSARDAGEIDVAFRLRQHHAEHRRMPAKRKILVEPCAADAVDANEHRCGASTSHVRSARRASPCSAGQPHPRDRRSPHRRRRRALSRSARAGRRERTGRSVRSASDHRLWQADAKGVREFRA